MTASTGEKLVAIVSEEPLLPDAMNFAATEKLVATSLSADVGAVENPRAVTSFTEDAGGRVYTVLSYDESAADAVKWKWNCSASREVFKS